jgi:hypothetical protein
VVIRRLESLGPKTRDRLCGLAPDQQAAISAWMQADVNVRIFLEKRWDFFCAARLRQSQLALARGPFSWKGE